MTSFVIIFPLFARRFDQLGVNSLGKSLGFNTVNAEAVRCEFDPFYTSRLGPMKRQ